MVALVATSGDAEVLDTIVAHLGRSADVGRRDLDGEHYELAVKLRRLEPE